MYFMYYDQIKEYDEIRKIAIRQIDDCTAGCLLDYQYLVFSVLNITYFIDHYQLVAVDLSKQKELNADPRAI